jgi:hypothetical protein
VATLLAPLALLDSPDTDSVEPEIDAPDEGVIVDGSGIARLGYRCWTETASDFDTGVFVVVHRAVVWDRRGVEIVAQAAMTRDAALNEALSRYLATADVPAVVPAVLAAATTEEPF